ncbi:hypothetical protein MXE74_14105, partial [Enterococcus faecalis]|nr:hypothetical protein [Enterococcus faecalis]
NSSSNLRGDFLLFPILKSPFKICVYLFKSIPKNVSTLLGYMQAFTSEEAEQMRRLLENSVGNAFVIDDDREVRSGFQV